MYMLFGFSLATQMKQLFQVFLLVRTLSTATQQVFYVLPDNSTNASCLFQSCATLSQYLLDNNGSLPVVSNVAYRFLPGEHLVPTNMTLQYLHNFTIIGSQSSTSMSPVIIGSLKSYVKVVDSFNVSIKNVVFKKHDMGILNKNYQKDLYNLAFTNCFSCKIMKVHFLEYGFCGENLMGESYLIEVHIDLIDIPLCCFSGIHLSYTSGVPAEYHSEHVQLVMKRVSITSNDTYTSVLTYNTGIHIQISGEFNYVNVLIISIINSHFYSMNQRVLDITSSGCATITTINIEGCKFSHNKYLQILAPQPTMIRAELPHVNATLAFIDCKMFNNYGLILVSVDEDLCCNPMSAYFALSSNVIITNCSFLNNNLTLLKLISSTPLANVAVYINGPVYVVGSYSGESASEILRVEKLNVYMRGPVYILNNSADFILSYYSCDKIKLFANINSVLLDGLIVASNNKADTIMNFHHGDITFNGPTTISENIGTIILAQSCIVTLNGPIIISRNDLCESVMRLQYSDVLFIGEILFELNSCYNIIALVSIPSSAYIEVMEYCNVTFSNNYDSNLIMVKTDNNNNYNINPLCVLQYVKWHSASVSLPSHYTIIISGSFPELSFYHFTSRCKWISTSQFQNYKPRAINQQIIQLDHEFQHLKHHSVIFYCSNFSVDRLGPVYPGQKLQVELCTPHSDNNSVLYAETNNVQLPKSACKISHQTELVNLITNNSTMVTYTIVSEANDSCELFLTVSPFLYEIYEVFDVQLLPCPIGFTLQNGVCKCDPLLPSDIDTCYIDQSAIRRPANTWISYTQSGDSKYLISDCPMDYCLPFSSYINLLHPDAQCQFSRSGILCSQCQRSLSMVFGSSRCMKCTNVHLLISVVFIVAGIVLVVFLYLLNLTVPKAAISGVILYVNIIIINDSIFTKKDKIFKPLWAFVFFTNLTLGIETCFYNGMDAYVLIWLRLFFPTFLMIIAFIIIIASRYSSRILRLTYSRSLPVLATLFLLSYTSVLRTVLTVLFSYSTITHAPSGHQELVWSVDASVPLFGLKFTILFIICLVLFLILLFFNIILLFVRCLSWFKLINHFKPILDAFQGSYKNRYYYWVAVHIILRSLFLCLKAFHMKIRLLLATIFLILYTAIFGYICPNKSKLINVQELILLINLTIMHAVSYYSSDSVFGIVTNLMISLAFIQFCLIVIYHFLTYTCNYNIENTLHSVREKLVNSFAKDRHAFDIALLDIPERTYNYSEYQDGLVSDDFAINS